MIFIRRNCRRAFGSRVAPSAAGDSRNTRMLRSLIRWVMIVPCCWWMSGSHPAAMAKTPSTQNAVPAAHAPSDRTKNRSFMDRQFHGIALPKEIVALAPTTTGWLTQILVKEGDRVQAGDALAVIDDRVARAAAEMARIDATSTARLRQAQLNVKQAESLFQRIQAAYAARAGNEIEVTDARYELERARADWDAEKERHRQLEQQWNLSKAELERHIIRAPFDGRVIQVHARLGESLGMQDKVVTIANLNALELELFLPVQLFGKLKSDQTYRLKAEEPVNGTVKAHLVSNAPMIDSATSTFRCVFAIDNSDGQLPAGFAAMLHLQAPNQRRGIAQY